jgi:tRNA(Ile)-lysidine synthase
MFKNIEQTIQHLITNKPKIVLGLSGGPDSVFLFFFLKKLHKEHKIELLCAHLDHGWRKGSARDTQFCKQLCTKYKIHCIVEHANNLSVNVTFNGSKEEFGRTLRRAFFEKILQKHNANYIALAHHQQDQQETFFFRIIRGTTLHGLSCMKLIENKYLRPLLYVSKKDILHYLHTQKIIYLIDHTNDSDDFLRNRIRKYVIPAIQKCDDRFNKKFESSITHLQKENIFLQRLTDTIFEKIFVKNNNNFIGNLHDFLQLNDVIQKRLLLTWLIKENASFHASQGYLNELLKFLKSKQGGSHNIGSLLVLHKKQNKFWLKN